MAALPEKSSAALGRDHRRGFGRQVVGRDAHDGEAGADASVEGRDEQALARPVDGDRLRVARIEAEVHLACRGAALGEDEDRPREVGVGAARGDVHLAGGLVGGDPGRDEPILDRWVVGGRDGAERGAEARRLTRRGVGRCRCAGERERQGCEGGRAVPAQTRNVTVTAGRRQHFGGIEHHLRTYATTPFSPTHVHDFFAWFRRGRCPGFASTCVAGDAGRSSHRRRRRRAHR